MNQQLQRIQFTGGVNLNKDPEVIRPDQLALSQNAFPVKSGILGKRQAFVVDRIAFTPDSSAYGTDFGDFLVLDWAVAGPQYGGKYVAHLFDRQATCLSFAQHYLYVGDMDKDSIVVQPIGTDMGNKILAIGGAQTTYEPVRFFTYRGVIIAVVPGIEGYYAYTKRADGTYKWYLNTFAPDPAVFTEGGTPVTQKIPITPRNACQYKQRVVWGNMGPGKGNWLAFADKATALTMQPLLGYSLMARVGTDALSLNGRHVEVGSIEGEDITAMQEISLMSTGAQIDSVLMLLTERSCVFVSGEILQTNDTGATDPNGLFGTYSENRVNYECGCVSQRTLVKTPYGWVWASGDDVWLLAGNSPIRIGTNIRPAILACPTKFRKYWSMAYANGVLVLQLVTDSGSTSNLATSNPDSITTYDHQYWYLDLRDGLPRNAEEAKWYGPMTLYKGEADWRGHLLSSREEDGSQRMLLAANLTAPLYGGGGSPYTIYPSVILDLFSKSGNAQDFDGLCITSAPEWQYETAYLVGDVVRPRIDGSNNPGFFATGHLYVCSVAGISDGNNPDWNPASGSTTIDGADVRWVEFSIGPLIEYRQQFMRMGNTVGHYTVDIRARNSLLEDTTHEKIIRRVDMSTSSSGPDEVSVSAILNNGPSSKSLGTINLGVDPPQLGADTALPFAIGDGKIGARAFRPSETELVKGRQAQIRIQDTNNYVIDDTNDYLILGVYFQDGYEGNISASAILQLHLTHGSYASLQDVFDMIESLASNYRDAMNTALASFSIVVDANPWLTFSAPYTGGLLFNRIAIVWSTPPAAQFNMMALIGAGTDGAANMAVVGDYTNTLYFTRSARLISMLGFAQDKTCRPSGVVNVAPLPISAAPSQIYYAFGIHSDDGSFKTKLDGTVQPFNYNSSRVDFHDAIVVIHTKPVPPFKNQGRS